MGSTNLSTWSMLFLGGIHHLLIYSSLLLGKNKWTNKIHIKLIAYRSKKNHIQSRLSAKAENNAVFCGSITKWVISENIFPRLDIKTDLDCRDDALLHLEIKKEKLQPNFKCWHVNNLHTIIYCGISV